MVKVCKSDIHRPDGVTTWARWVAGAGCEKLKFI